MAHRVSFSASRIKISKAGVDVTTATPDQLLFDDRDAPYNGIHLSGRVLASAFSETTTALSGGTKYTRTATVSFGKTFPVVPRLLCGIIDPNDSGAFTPDGFFNDSGMTAVSGISTGAALSLSYVASTNQVVFTIIYIYYNGPGYTRTLDVPYIVLKV